MLIVASGFCGVILTLATLYLLKSHRKEKSYMKNEENILLSIYGARVSKSGKYVNITLVKGEGDAKTFYTTCVKLDKTAKTYAKLKDDKAFIVVPLLKNDKEKSKDDLPFDE